MHTIALRFVALVLAAGALADAAHAQEATTAEETAVPSLQLEQPLAQPLTYEEFQRGEIERGIRRSRSALIGTSVATVVGAAVFYPLVISCIELYLPEGSEPKCGRGADAGIWISSLVLSGGVIGTIVTGIMLGIRKGKLRRLDDRGRYGNPRAVTWDPVRSSFVF